MSYFKRIIRRSRKVISVDGQDWPEAGQHRVRLPSQAADRTSDLSIYRNDEWNPVLDRVQEDDSNEGMSSEYVGNSNVSSGNVSGMCVQSGTVHTEHSQFVSFRSSVLERVRSSVNQVVLSSDNLQSDKAHKTESESERVELNVSEETGLPRGNRSGPVADVILDDTHEDDPIGLPLLQEDLNDEPAVDVGPDQLLFGPQKQLDAERIAGEPCEAGSIDAALSHPAVPEGVVQALEKVKADAVRQRRTVPERTKPAKRPQGLEPAQMEAVSEREQVAEREQVTIGRVSVKIRMPDPIAGALSPSPSYSGGQLASRLFMGEV